MHEGIYTIQQKCVCVWVCVFWNTERDSMPMTSQSAYTLILSPIRHYTPDM